MLPRLGVLASALILVACGQDAERITSPHDPERLVAAAAAGDRGEVRRLLHADVDVDARDSRNRTSVTAAAIHEHVGVVRLLIDAGADVDLQDDDRNNPLLVSGESGNVDLLREVLRADPDLTRTNRFGGTALIPASDAVTSRWSASYCAPTSQSTTSTASAGRRYWRR